MAVHTILIDPKNPRSGFTSPSPRRARFARTTAGRPGSRSTRTEVAVRAARPGRGGRPLCSSHRAAPVAAGRGVHAKALGHHAQRTMRASNGTRSAAICRRTLVSRLTFMRTNRKRSTSCPSRAIRCITRRTANCACIAARPAATNGRPLTKGLPQQHCYVNVLRDAMAVDQLDPCGVYFGTTGGQVYCSPDGGDSGIPLCAICRRCCRSRCRR
jgi:hypothetical protein